MTLHELHRYCIDKVGVDNCIYTDFDGTFRVPRLLPPDYMIQVPCGKCVECLKVKRLSWSHRLSVEVMTHPESTFITLTLDDKYLQRFKDDPKRPLMLYIDRLRKYLGYRPKYFFVSELGEKNGRLHYHGVFFGTSKDGLSYFVQRDKWKYGLVWLAPFCDCRTANYITKYMLKTTKDYKPFILCSNGIGLAYVNNKNKLHFINKFDFNSYARIGNAYYPLHRYYQDKFLDDDLRLCKMLNNYNSYRSSFIFRGVKYNDELDYLRARSRYYEWTKNLINYGNFHNSQTRTRKGSVLQSESFYSEIHEFCSRNSNSDSLQGYLAGRQDQDQYQLFD